MKKINYPTDNKEIEDLKKEYLTRFDTKIKQMQQQWEPLCYELRALNNNSSESLSIYPNEIKDLLIADYETLVDVYINYRYLQGGKTKYEELDIKLSKIFHYSGVDGSPFSAFQPQIANFFMEHARTLDVYVCNYCEMAYVNEFGFKNRYSDIASFLISGNEKEIRRYVRSSSGKDLKDKTIKSIMDLRKNNDITNIVTAFDSMGIWKPIIAKSAQIENRLYNHFDLDHFLPKSKCPLVGLSLFNFVPSCSVCNEKLKRADEISADNKDRLLALSPTSPHYDFDREVTINLSPHPNASWLRTQEHEQDFYIELKTNNLHYQKEIDLFHLDERYNYHKCEALRLQDKILEYPEDKLKMMSSALGGGFYTPQKIREDMLDEEFRDNNNRCFNKMKRDIIKQMRIKSALNTKKRHHK